MTKFGNQKPVWIKNKFVKAARQNRPIPQWLRLKSSTTQKFSNNRRHWRRTKLCFSA